MKENNDDERFITNVSFPYIIIVEDLLEENPNLQIELRDKAYDSFNKELIGRKSLWIKETIKDKDCFRYKQKYFSIRNKHWERKYVKQFLALTSNIRNEIFNDNHEKIKIINDNDFHYYSCETDKNNSSNYDFPILIEANKIKEYYSNIFKILKKNYKFLRKSIDICIKMGENKI